jgi:beta-lactam-binding protein with PASTA domain
MQRAVIIFLAAFTIAGCGGSSEPVPDVVGERLDVAKSEVSDAGYDTEELGGGTFGIVDESNWIVCETRPAAGASDAGAVKLIVERSCEDAGGGAASTAEPQDTPKPERTAQATPEPQSTATQRPARVRVPDVVGMDHQAAQDRLQGVGLYNLRERDASGQGRALLFDRNWTVVSQRPAAGKRVPESRVITLASVKDGE